MKNIWKKAISFLAIFVAFFVVSACGNKKTKEYTVTFKGGIENITVAVKANTLVSKPETDPIKDGYVFSGWYADTAYKNEFDFENTKIKKDTTIYAKFVVLGKVHFKTNGGSSIESKSCSELIEAPVTTKEGHSFDGWYYDSSFNNPVTFPTKINGTITMYAKWITTGYDITFVTNSDEIITPNPITKDYGSILEEKHLSVEMKPGAKSFGGWYLDEKLTQKVEFPYTVSENTTFYAKWIMREVYVHFMDMGLGEENAEITELAVTKYYGSNISLSNIDYYKRDYNFLGWYLESTLINQVPSTYTLTPNLKDEVLHVYFYARMELNNNTVALDPNGGHFSGSYGIKTFAPSDIGEPIHIQINNQKPFKLGYRFLGYAVRTSDGLGSYIVDIDEFNKNVLNNTYTLIAKWEEVDYKVYLQLPNSIDLDYIGTYKIDGQKINISKKISDSDKVKEGHSYQGVCVVDLSNQKCGTTYIDSEFIINDSSDLYAIDEEDAAQGKWYRMIILNLSFSPNRFNLMADANGGTFDYGSKINFTDVEYGTSLKNLNVEIPKLIGYNWAGWKVCVSEDCVTVTDNKNTPENELDQKLGEIFVNSDNMTLTAIWEIKRYSLSVGKIGNNNVKLATDIPHGVEGNIYYLDKWDEAEANKLCENEKICIIYLGVKHNKYDLVVKYTTSEYESISNEFDFNEFNFYNIEQYNGNHFIGFYNDTLTNYVSNFSMIDNTTLYPKYDSSKEIVYKILSDGKTYSANSFKLSENIATSITVSSVFMGKEVSTIDKECFLTEDALKISTLFIPETVTTIQKDSFIYLLNLDNITIPIYSNSFSFSNIFGTNSEYIISNLSYLKITGATLETFDYNKLEGLKYLKYITELYLPYSITNFALGSVEFLSNLEYLSEFAIEIKENSNQKFYVINETSNFVVYRISSGVKELEIKRNAQSITERVEDTYSISFINEDMLSYSSMNKVGVKIGDRLVDFNNTDDFIPEKEGYTFMGWWYYEDIGDGTIKFTEPYIYDNLKVMFASDVRLCARFIEGIWNYNENNELVAIAEVYDLDELHIEKYYRGKVVEKISLVSGNEIMENIKSIYLPETLKFIQLSNKLPNLERVSMVGNMDCYVGSTSNICNVYNILQSAKGDFSEEGLELEIVIQHSSNPMLNQITNTTFANLEGMYIKALYLPSSLIFDINTYEDMFKSLNKVNEFIVEEIDGFDNVKVSSDNGCLYALVYANNGSTEWALLKSPIKRELTSINTLTIIDGQYIKRIAPYAFYQIDNIESISMKDSQSNSQVHSIGKKAFAEMKDLKNIDMGMGVRFIDISAFDDSYSIEQFNIDPFNGVYSVIDGVLFKDYETILVKYPANKDESSYSIPLSVKTIEKNAFILNSSKLLNLTISENVENISGYNNASELSAWEDFELSNFTNVISFEVDDKNANFTSVNGALYNKDLTVLLHFGKQSDSKEIFIEPTVINIATDAFVLQENSEIAISDMISSVLITNYNKQDVSILLENLDEYFVESGFDTSVLKIYFTEFSGYDYETDNQYGLYVAINTELSKYSFHLHSEGNVIVNGNSLSVTPNGYFVYESLILDVAPISTSSGVFMGWYLDSNYTTPALFPLLSVGTGEMYVNLYAKFGTYYTVNFDSRGGNYITSKYYIDAIKNDSSLPIPTKSGYSFGGWYLDSSLTKPLFVGETEAYYLSLPVTTLYAKWNVTLKFYVYEKDENSNLKFQPLLNEQGEEDWKNKTGDSIVDCLGKEKAEQYRWYLDEGCTIEISANRAINNAAIIYGKPVYKIQLTLFEFANSVTEKKTIYVCLGTKVSQIEEVASWVSNHYENYITYRENEMSSPTELRLEEIITEEHKFIDISSS